MMKGYVDHQLEQNRYSHTCASNSHPRLSSNPDGSARGVSQHSTDCCHNYSYR